MVRTNAQSRARRLAALALNPRGTLDEDSPVKSRRGDDEKGGSELETVDMEKREERGKSRKLNKLVVKKEIAEHHRDEPSNYASYQKNTAKFFGLLPPPTK